jgi:hypothetical protein
MSPICRTKKLNLKAAEDFGSFSSVLLLRGPQSVPGKRVRFPLPCEPSPEAYFSQNHFFESPGHNHFPPDFFEYAICDLRLCEPVRIVP